MSPGRFNVPMPTFGGRQFWSDCQFFRGWRIQQHFYSEHFRLLNPSNTRRAWGTLEECQLALEEEKRTRKLEPMSGTAVIALHGILRSSHVWCDMETAMKPDGVTFVRIDYPSTQKPIDDFAVQLQSVIHSLEGIDEIHLVAHSLGGLVVRKWCQDYSDPRVKRLVMIGTPNCGAELADMLQRNWIFRGVFGPSGQQLVSNAEGFINQLARPTMEFAVIAGAKGTPDGYNPLIPGDDDGIVTLKSALLPGAVDSITVAGLHSFQPWNPEVIAAARRYLKTGALRETGVREPIPLEPKLEVENR
ncbi:MAG: alpha/beta fold hydrolase [Planctomycetaceae bacterium]